MTTADAWAELRDRLLDLRRVLLAELRRLLRR